MVLIIVEESVKAQQAQADIADGRQYAAHNTEYQAEQRQQFLLPGCDKQEFGQSDQADAGGEQAEPEQ
ncbi:hypothetical protein [Marinobacterium rhizophilum]|uniref:hypothetical protein n=1 Tax=Marinobacterium rhizophilum TaxID=420402 RepID=UPI0012EC75B5|nr:hypothetical protein [Marinobacterium rhizophilum]